MKKLLMTAQCCICFLLAADVANAQNNGTPTAKIAPDENALKPVVLKTTKPVETAKDADKYKPVAPVINDLVPSDKQIKEDKNQQKVKPAEMKLPDTRTAHVNKVELKEIPPVPVAAPVLRMTPVTSPVQKEIKKPLTEQQKQN